MTRISTFNQQWKQIRHNSPIQKLASSCLSKAQVSVFVKRDDLIHPLISGNKWRKLFYNLTQAIQNERSGIISFGGAFSNHIHALATAGNLFSIPTIGIIRGPELDNENPTLKYAQQMGMKTLAVSRTEYRQRNDPGYLAELQRTYPNWLIVPEGGSNTQAMSGVADIIPELLQADTIQNAFDYICSPVGSGGTIAGLSVGLSAGFSEEVNKQSLNSNTHILGFSVLKGAEYLAEDVANLIKNYSDNEHMLQLEQHKPNWSINHEFHFNGYAKLNDELVKFCHDFKNNFSIPIEPVYSGKMFYGIFELIKRGYFAKGTRIVAIHTGGLQGIDGMKYMKRLPADF